MKGRRTGGAAPFGFIRTTGGFSHHPEEAPIRKLIFNLFLKHKRKLTVATELNKKGYKTRSGAKFSDISVDRLLRDPIVLGHHRDNFVSSHGSKKFKTLKPKTEWVYQELPELIDQETWDEAWQILHKNEKTRATKAPAGIFGEKLRCKCQGKLSHPQGRQYYYCNSCDNKIEKSIVDEVLVQRLKQFPASQILLKDIDNSSDNDALPYQSHSLEKDSERLKSAIDRLYEIYMNGAISPAKFKQKNLPLEAEYASVRQFIDENSNSVRGILGEDSLEGANIGGLWATGNDTLKREIVSQLVNNIIVGIDTIDITFSTKPLSL